MAGIKGVGEGVVETILEERKSNGSYRSLYDFIRRIDTRKVGKKVIEHLIEAGCFDFTLWTRPQLLASVEPMYDEAMREQKDAAKGIMNLFALLEEEQQERFLHPPVLKEEATRRHLLKREFELLGIYLNGHPLDEYQSLLQKLSCVPLSELEALPKGSVARIAFIIEGLVIKISQKSQRKFAILTIGDGVERFELPIWPDLYEEKGALLTENQLLYAVVQKEVQEGQSRLQCRWIDDLSKANEAMIEACDKAYDLAKHQAKTAELREKSRFSNGGRSTVQKEPEPKKKAFQKLKVQCDIDLVRLSHILLLKEAFRSHSGEIPIEVSFAMKEGKAASVLIDAVWGVDYRRELEEKVKQIESVKSMIWES
jgi:DNA polymerase-3 subunit alpha